MNEAIWGQYKYFTLAKSNGVFFRAFLFCEQKKGSVAVKTFSMKIQTRKMLYQEKKIPDV